MSFSIAKPWAIGAATLALAVSQPPALAQEVVQSLPPEGTQELNRALQRLARNGDDVGALLDAGDAAMRLGDIAAAIGFYGRAQAIDPDRPRIALGLARAYTFSRRPVEALRLFAEAERGGIPLSTMAAERGLAFDLVGDAASAQSLYRLAIAAGGDDGTRRNLALSQAISGDKTGFEATLLPMLESGDNAAWRTRAFGLAILGETEAAVKIARDMMRPDMAGRIEPYLRYMTELTPAQQAAAGALGVFPRTAAIGRDDAQIAAYATSSDPGVRDAADALAPAGPPLGSSRTAQPIVEGNEGELPAIAANDALPPVTRPQVSEQISTAPPQETTVSPPASAPAQPAERASLDDAFADFDLSSSASTAPRQGAVDIRTIEVPRENAEPAAPAHPARHWVQVATGRDIEALGFDWRRIGRNSEGILAGKSAFTARWGEANRLLAGPYDSAADARDAVGRLRAAGFDSFPFSSEEGQAVFPLAGASAAPEAARPAHPERYWVQVATGRDLDALGFDWRRIQRRADGALDGRGPFTAPWGQANRLLAGPFDSPTEARAMVNRLKTAGIDTFAFTSEEGEAVNPLD